MAAATQIYKIIFRDSFMMCFFYAPPPKHTRSMFLYHRAGLTHTRQTQDGT